MKALLLNGSPNPNGGTSGALGAHLMARLGERGFEVETLRINAQLKTPEGTEEMLAAADGADVLVLSFPVYVDSLPAQTTRALQLIARRRAGRASPRPARFLAVTNCGFPEPEHTRVPLAICRCFARDAGLEWAGGLGRSMGGAFDGRPLARLGSMARLTRQALDLAADALAAGRPVPEEAAALLEKLPMPTWLYRAVGNWNWRRLHRRSGTKVPLDAAPYAEAAR